MLRDRCGSGGLQLPSALRQYSLAIWQDGLGIEATEEEMRVVLLEVKTKSLEWKGLLDEDEFYSIAQSLVCRIR